MKRPFYAACTVLALLTLNATAQPEHNANDGEDHSGHAHSQPSEKSGDKKGARETRLDKLWGMSDKAFHDGDYPRAISFHKAIVILDPQDTESYGVAAWLMWSMGKKDEALAHLERGLKANPINSEMWDVAGQQYDLQKKETPALAVNAKDAFLNAVRFLPASADKNESQMLRRRLAHASEKAGDLKLSLAVWRELVVDFPEDVVNKNNLARVEKTMAAKRKTAMMPFVVGGAGIATIALLGGVLRSRKLRANSLTKV